MRDPEAEKKRLRAEARARRAALGENARLAGSRALVAVDLSPLRLPPTVVIAGFCAIGDEIDPSYLLAHWAARGAGLALPAVRETHAALEFRRWTPGAPLQAGRWGIQEPGPDAPLVTPQVILTPLLAFDRSGARIGYGGGFYDRSLAELRRGGTVLAIGVAFAEQEVDAVPCLDYDQRLDWVLTPARLLQCTGT